MKKMILAVCVVAVLGAAFLLSRKKPVEGDAYTQVANQLVELINDADYPGVEQLFNTEMSRALPLDKATDFFTSLTTQVGKIEKLGAPVREEGWTIYPAHCERGILDMSLALDEESEIAGLKFEPSGR